MEVKSPMASTELTMYMMSMEMMEVSSNFMPKCMGMVNWNQPAAFTFSKDTMPITRARAYPKIIPMSIEASLQIPLVK